MRSEVIRNMFRAFVWTNLISYFQAIKLVQSLPTLTWAVTHQLHKASILAWQRKIICQNLILKHYECHPVLLLLIEM